MARIQLELAIADRLMAELDPSQAIVIGVVELDRGGQGFRPVAVGSLEMMRLQEQPFRPMDGQILHRADPSRGPTLPEVHSEPTPGG